MQTRKYPYMLSPLAKNVKTYTNAKIHFYSCCCYVYIKFALKHYQITHLYTVTHFYIIMLILQPFANNCCFVHKQYA